MGQNLNIKNHAINHLAIIMDGNARWAAREGIKKSEGHKRGAEVARSILHMVMKQNIPYLSLYAFSSENWGRDSSEVDFLLSLLWQYLKREAASLQKNGIRLKIIGDFSKLTPKLQDIISQVNQSKVQNIKMTLFIALSYGGRSEIVDACNKLARSNISNITESDFAAHLYEPNMPNVDLMIRTGGILRISNFLLWQSAYAELYFSEKYWPEFGEEDLMAAIDDFKGRNRTFGVRKREC